MNCMGSTLMLICIETSSNPSQGWPSKNNSY